ncbi:hypothetical protein [Streptomyces sp. OE57]
MARAITNARGMALLPHVPGYGMSAAWQGLRFRTRG